MFFPPTAGEALASGAESVLNISYRINGDRTMGAHMPVVIESSVSETVKQDLIFKSALVLQRPVLDPCLAVGFLPFPSDGLRVGQLVTVNWRIERLKDAGEMVPQNNVSIKCLVISLLLYKGTFEDFGVHLKYR